MTIKSNNGGYKIIDFAKCPITTGSQSATLPNVYSTINNNKNKPILVDNLTIDTVSQLPFYVYFKRSSGNYIADLGDYVRLTVTSSDNVYVSSTEPEPPTPTPSFEPNVLDLSSVGGTIWNTITEVEGAYDTILDGSVVIHGVASSGLPAVPLMPDFTGQFFKYFTGSKDILCMQIFTGWDETNGVPYVKYLCVSEDDEVGIVSSPEAYLSN